MLPKFHQVRKDPRPHETEHVLKEIFIFNDFFRIYVEIYICVWQNICHFFVHVSFYQIIWVQCYTSIDESHKHYAQNLRQDLLIHSGRTCKARVETEVGT